MAGFGFFQTVVLFCWRCLGNCKHAHISHRVCQTWRATGMIIAHGVRRICGKEPYGANSCMWGFVSAKEKQQRRRWRQPALLHRHHPQRVPFCKTSQSQQKT